MTRWLAGSTVVSRTTTGSQLERIENGNTDATPAPPWAWCLLGGTATASGGLGFADGVRPQSGAKVQFTGSGTGLRISVFANGPGGGPSKLCEPG